VRRARIGDVERRLVEREGEPVRADEIITDEATLARDPVDPIDVASVDLALSLVSLVGARPGVSVRKERHRYPGVAAGEVRHA